MNNRRVEFILGAGCLCPDVKLIRYLTSFYVFIRMESIFIGDVYRQRAFNAFNYTQDFIVPRMDLPRMDFFFFYRSDDSFSIIRIHASSHSSLLSKSSSFDKLGFLIEEKRWLQRARFFLQKEKKKKRHSFSSSSFFFLNISSGYTR